jgi:NO-binding membrane sensor protein with MHYT domain
LRDRVTELPLPRTVAGRAATLLAALFLLVPSAAWPPWGLRLVALAAAAICFLRPRVGVLLWAGSAAAVSAPLLRYRNAVVLVAVVLPLALALGALWSAGRRRGRLLPESSLTAPLLMLAAAAVLSTAQAVLVPDPAIDRAAC